MERVLQSYFFSKLGKSADDTESLFFKDAAASVQASVDQMKTYVKESNQLQAEFIDSKIKLVESSILKHDLELKIRQAK